jgi:hypothetical protein
MYNDGSGQNKVLLRTSTCKTFALDVPRCVKPEILFCPDEAIACNFEGYRAGLLLCLFEETLVPIENVEI